MALNLRKIEKILSAAIILAKEYKKITNKPLGITGEVAEFTAFKLLKLELTGARQPGYDAIWNKAGKRKRVQIKGRKLPDEFQKSPKDRPDKAR